MAVTTQARRHGRRRESRLPPQTRQSLRALPSCRPTNASKDLAITPRTFTRALPQLPSPEPRRAILDRDWKCRRPGAVSGAIKSGAGSRLREGRRAALAMDLLTIVATIISVAASLITIVLFFQFVRDRGRITWRVVERAMRKVMQEMDAEDYKPDLIIGVGRGGAIVGGMLAGNLGHIPLFVVDTILDRSRRVSEARVRYPDVCPQLAGQRVLLAIGELYSGEDLKVVCGYVDDREPADSRTLALFSHPAAGIRTDFLGKRTRRPLDAPWRLTEAYRNRRL